jgi:uncharacterized protein (TIGR02284 family)
VSKDPIKAMNDLIHLDQDAIRAYEQAIEACEIPEIRATLTEFQGDHQRHVRDLDAKVRSMGGEPPAGRDIKGFFIEGFTALTSMGDRSALMAMRANEELTTHTYRSALEQALPADVSALIEENYKDEVRHLSWIKQMQESRGWEKPKAA